MRVIVKRRWRKNSNEQDEISTYMPKRTTELTKLLRELWEREYNSYDPEPYREESWLKEKHARIENDIYVTEYFVTTLVEV